MAGALAPTLALQAAHSVAPECRSTGGQHAARIPCLTLLRFAGEGTFCGRCRNSNGACIFTIDRHETTASTRIQKEGPLPCASGGQGGGKPHLRPLKKPSLLPGMSAESGMRMDLANPAPVSPPSCLPATTAGPCEPGQSIKVSRSVPASAI